jgi:hypothetical protein
LRRGLRLLRLFVQRLQRLLQRQQRLVAGQEGTPVATPTRSLACCSSTPIASIAAVSM